MVAHAEWVSAGNGAGVAMSGTEIDAWLAKASYDLTNQPNPDKTCAKAEKIWVYWKKLTGDGGVRWYVQPSTDMREVRLVEPFVEIDKDWHFNPLSLLRDYTDG